MSRGKYSDLGRNSTTPSFPVEEELTTIDAKTEKSKSFLENYLDKNKEKVADSLKTAGIGMVYKGKPV